MPPQLLSHTSLRVLEFDSLRDLLRGYASSPLGQALISALAPSTDRDWINQQHQLTSEIREFRRVGGSFDFSSLLDVVKLLEKSRIAGAARSAQAGILNVASADSRHALIEYTGPRSPGVLEDAVR